MGYHGQTNNFVFIVCVRFSMTGNPAYCDTAADQKCSRHPRRPSQWLLEVVNVGGGERENGAQRCRWVDRYDANSQYQEEPEQSCDEAVQWAMGTLQCPALCGAGGRTST